LSHRRNSAKDENMAMQLINGLWKRLILLWYQTKGFRLQLFAKTLAKALVEKKNLRDHEK